MKRWAPIIYTVLALMAAISAAITGSHSSAICGVIFSCTAVIIISLGGCDNGN